MSEEYRIFIDGRQGTTGLKIMERLSDRDDIKLLILGEAERRDVKARRTMINSSDLSFLCLPDDAAREAVSFLNNEHTKIIDTSTAHRVCPDFAYGFAELSKEHKQKIIASNKCAVPGCHATGFIALVYPLIEAGLVDKDLAFSAFSITGYSGGGKKMIAEYNGGDRNEEYDSPRFYALAQSHKHLKEMQKISGLSRAPIFNPVVCDFYSGMLITVPLFTHMLKEPIKPTQLRLLYEKKYAGSKLISVLPFGAESGFFASNALSDTDKMQILVSGNDERLTLMARFDNLGKGACGAAIQCMNLMLGIDEMKGLKVN